MAEYSREDLENYVSFFPQEQTDAVAKALLDEDLLKRALDTQNGRVLLNNVIGTIRSKVISIVKMCFENYETKLPEIKQACMEIQVSYKLLHNWAGIIKEGEQHTEKMLKK